MTPDIDYSAMLDSIYALSAAHRAAAPTPDAVPALLTPAREPLLRALLSDSLYIVTSMCGADTVAALDRGTDTDLRRLWQTAVAIHALAVVYEGCQPALAEALRTRYTAIVAEIQTRAGGMPAHIQPFD